MSPTGTLNHHKYLYLFLIFFFIPSKTHEGRPHPTFERLCSDILSPLLWSVVFQPLNTHFV